MPTWNSAQYMKFGDERTRPSRDLASRIDVSQPARVIDLGCGPGNSTQVLAQQWPDADLTGLDNSAAMIDAARTTYPRNRWVAADIAQWASVAGERYDVVFSNAALHWLPEHDRLLPQLIRHVTPGGALAFQVPADDSPAHRLMRSMADTRKLHVADWQSNDTVFYYDVLSSCAARVDLWETEYLHVMADAEGIVEWYRGTGMRPFLDALPTELERDRFTSEFLAQARELYSPRPNGQVLFPFRRVFGIAYAQ